MALLRAGKDENCFLARVSYQSKRISQKKNVENGPESNGEVGFILQAFNLQAPNDHQIEIKSDNKI